MTAAVPALGGSGVAGVLSLPEVEVPPAADELRRDVRRFLAEQLDAGTFTPRCDNWLRGHDPAFSAELGRRGWIGMTWPARYGGGDRTLLERYVVTEELLAAGAPVAAHWGVDRQIGPAILRFGTEAQRARFLPSFARGEVFMAAAMSEPDSGSDLASLRTRAVRVDGGWRLTGRKVWTSHAHRAHYVVVLCRTSSVEEGGRHGGISQLIVELPSPGVEVRPIAVLTGEAHFNEVVFDDVFVPDDLVLGNVGDGWLQIGAELALERSGPDRMLSALPLLAAFAEAVRNAPEPGSVSTLGRLVAELVALRRLSMSITVAVAEGREPTVAAALVKDLGTSFEQRMVEAVRAARPPVAAAADPAAATRAFDALEEHLRDAILSAPGFTLRGGTTEILRSIVAKALVRS